ncbi:flagellar hook capping FlgD N-terminal domain-containing protein [Kineococcus sp. LSe6-4]|uniref:Basal-body rod modification protein FlgD n=1 Tax=Kineococcus halophytocola TaxID=3234027 RepID=A0ABV4H397_9ACTN
MTIDAAGGANPYASLIANSDVLTQTNAAKNAGRADTSALAQQKTKDDKDMFLKLLVAQLRYQDPSKPADTTQFMAQTAQFSALEAMQDVAKQSTSMVAAQNKLQASALVGQHVSYTGEDGKVVTGEVTSVSFTQQSAGGTAGEPVLNVGGVSVVLSKVTGVGTIDAAALNAAAEKEAAQARAKTQAPTGPQTPAANATTGSPTTGSPTTGSSATPTGTPGTAGATGTSGATASTQTTGPSGTTATSSPTATSSTTPSA